MLYTVVLPLAATPLCYILYHALEAVYSEVTSPLARLPGPANTSLLLGNFNEITSDATLEGKWRAMYGPVFRYRSFFSRSQLFVADLKALSHIIAHGARYQKPPFLLVNVERTLGHGILSVEMDEHKRQRRILNQAFGVAQIRLLTDTFVDKAVQLRDIWSAQLAQGAVTGQDRIDVVPWMRRLTLDIIGKAGFNYEFNALDVGDKPNELNEVFTELLHSPRARVQTMFRLVQAMVPVLRLFPVPGWRTWAHARAKMFDIGRSIFLSSKACVSDEDKYAVGKRDLLSILLRANMSEDVGPTYRLTDEEVISQIPTFLLAGHETTSGAVTWALHALSLNVAAQTKLREELLSVEMDNPTMDELNALPYLEHVVREVLRLHSPVIIVQRMAVCGDVLPLGKPMMDRDGKFHDSLHVPKGQMVHIPLLGVNTDPEIWGDDAGEFKPERWEALPDSVHDIPGIWANLMTFWAGPHNCVGFKFSLVETKAILYTLLREFEFAPAVAEGGIRATAFGFLRPLVVDSPESGTSLPLVVRKYALAV